MADDLAVIPLDGRPCNARFPAELARLAGYQLRVPELNLLGSAAQPAQRDRLRDWLQAQAADCKHVLISLDTWLYGNLVASRKNSESLESIQQRLTDLLNLQKAYPDLQIHVFATLLRLSNSNDNTEERPYWAQHGQQIYRYAWLEDALKKVEDDRQGWQEEYADLEAAIPLSIRNDYRALRTRNHQVLQATIQAVQTGQLRSLLIGCDDSGEYGWTRQERQALQEMVATHQLEQDVLIYPGADELASVLVARTLIPTSPTIQLAWTWPEARYNTTRYEGLALEQTLRVQAQAVGIQLSEQAADGLLWLHNPPGQQTDQFLERQQRSPQADLQGLWQALEADLPLALADLYYANGGDIQLLSELESRQDLFKLDLYAGWNTAGNTLGYLLAWFKIYLARRQTPDFDAQFQQKLLLERLADDGWYQGDLRQKLSQHYSDPISLQTCLQAISSLNTRFKNWLNWIPGPPAALQIKQLSFPWKRFFEVDLQICFKTESDEKSVSHSRLPPD